jgi:sulfatase modifying factor 1
MRSTRLLAIALLVAATGGGLASPYRNVVIVGHPGNPPDTRFATPGFGNVDCHYHVAMFEITAEQYADFLNSVATTDTYGLYHPSMAHPGDGAFGCNIQRSGSPGSYTYSVADDWADRPVNYVDWGDAARYCNWLHNGLPQGAQDLATTEDGAYFLNGATTNAELLAVTRAPNAIWFLPTEHEWYKAAYHTNDGPTAHYFTFPTQAPDGDVPSNDLLDPDPGNSANFYQDGFAVGGPYYRTPVGAFANSGGAYGTFDQGGNVAEWTESVTSDGSQRIIRGGSFHDTANALRYDQREPESPTTATSRYGFRVAGVRETPREGDYIIAGGLGAAYAIDPVTGLIRACVYGYELRANHPFPTPTCLLTGYRTDILTAPGGALFARTGGTYDQAFYEVDPLAGTCSLLPNGDDPLLGRNGEIIWRDGHTVLIAADAYFESDCFGSYCGRVVSYDLDTQAVTLVSGADRGAGPLLFQPRSLARLDENTVLVAELGVPSGEFGLFRVDLPTGDRTFVSRLSQNSLSRPLPDGTFVTLGDDEGGVGPVGEWFCSEVTVVSGRILVHVSIDLPGDNTGGLIEVDPVTGDRTLLLGHAYDENGSLIEAPPTNPQGLPYAARVTGILPVGPQRIVMASVYDGRILSYDLATGAYDLVSYIDGQLIGGAELMPESIAIYHPFDPGDMNCDGAVTAADIDPFVVALVEGENAYQAAFPHCAFIYADCNRDLVVSAADIDAFVNLLVGG